MSEPLGEVMIRLGLDNSKFGSELSRSQKLVKYATSQMKANFSAMGAGGNKVAALTQKQRDLNQVIVAQQERVKALEKAYKGSFDQNGKAGRSTAKLATQLQNAKAKLGGYQHQLVVTAQAAAKARVETTGLTGTMNRLGKGATQAGQKMSSVGGKMTTRFTVPIVAGLTAAVKSAVDFDSQIAEMGPLLTDGGKVTKEYRLQLDKLAESSKKWAGQYGISTSVINNAMSELIKRGFTAQQTLGAMPSVLDATKASGEDLGIVMQATASIMEQFGLKGKTTEETLKNTQRVTDSLTYAANATAAGFGDMSDAMAYVGPVAKSLKLSVEDTAAAIGVLSDQGIEGQKAGTNLRGILTSLVNVTPAAKEQFAKMGISAKQAGEDASDLPKLIDDITKGTKGWTAQAKAKALATIFGRQNQAAMNALIAAGSDELRTLTKETESAGGATKKVADQMNETKANQIKRMVENIKQMGITIGQKLLPLLPPLLNNVNGMIDGFNKLDKSTQNNIIKWVALTAAMGPALKIGGSALQLIGGANTGIVQLASKIAQWRAKQAVLNSTVAAGTEATGAFTTGLAGAGAKTGMLTKLLSPAGLAIAGVGTALVVGKVAWDKWGQAAHDSGERSKRWGTDVGKAADDSLQSIKGASTQASEALEGFGKSGAESAKSVQTAFKKMYKTVKGDNETSTESMKNLYESMPPAAQAAYKKTLDTQTKAANERTSQAEKINKAVNDIVAASIKSGKNLTDDQKAVLNGYITEMQETSVKSLNVSAKQRKQIMKALNGDYSQMTDNDLAAMAGHFEQMSQASAKSYKKTQSALKEQLNKGQITKKSYQDTMNAMDEDYMVKNGQIMDARIDAERASGMSYKAIWAAMSRETGMSVEKLQNLYDKWSKSATKNTAIASKATNKAGKAWNELVLDPKTGKVKTNAQEEVNKAAKSKKGWENLKYDLKHAKLTTNAKTMIGVAAIQNGRWDSLTWKEQKAMIVTKGSQSLVKAMQKSGEWNDLSIAAKEAVISAKGVPELADATVKYGLWNQLPTKTKNLLVRNKEAVQKLEAAGISVDEWREKYIGAPKNAAANDKASPNLKTAKKNADNWRNTKTGSVKKAFATDQASHDLKLAKANADRWRGTSTGGTKHAFGTNNAGSLNVATGNANRWRNTSIGATKKAKARDQASGPAKVATNGVAAFRRQKNHTVTLTTVVNRVTKWISKKITGHQKGTNDFGGGLAMINDQPGPRFRELIQYPNGQLSVFHGRNVVVPDFPRHTKIYPANITAKLLPGLKQYASGKNVPANAEIVDMTRNLNETTNQTVMVNNANTVSLNDATLEKMGAAIAKHMPTSNAPVYLVMDGKTVGQIVGPIINNQNGRNINLSARGVTT